jgi:hypothetical protein
LYSIPEMPSNPGFSILGLQGQGHESCIQPVSARNNSELAMEIN